MHTNDQDRQNHLAGGPVSKSAGPLPRDRVLKSLAFEQPDICPYYVWIDEAMAGPLAEHYGVEDVKDTVITDHQVMREIIALRTPLSDDTLWMTLARSGDRVQCCTLSGRRWLSRV